VAGELQVPVRTCLEISKKKKKEVGTNRNGKGLTFSKF
jgi:hypothetical protein